MGARHSRLAAAMAAAWEAEVISARRLTAFAERVEEPGARARLLVLAAFCRAHASRVLARLAALGRGPLPVPPEDVTSDQETVIEGIHREIAAARAGSHRYRSMAEVARSQSDLSTAWVCELNRAESDDLAIELSRLLEGRLTRGPPEAPTTQ